MDVTLFSLSCSIPSPKAVPLTNVLITPRLLHLHISISNNQLHISTWLVLPTSQIQSFKAEFLIYLSQTYLTMLRTFIKGTQVGIIFNFSLCLSHLPHSVALNQIFFHHLISSPTTYELYDLEQLIFPTLPCLISKIKIIFLTCQGTCKN